MLECKIANKTRDRDRDQHQILYRQSMNKMLFSTTLPSLHRAHTPIFYSTNRLSKIPKLPLHLPSLKASSLSLSSSSLQMPSQIVEHVVLFNVRPDTEPAKLDYMHSSLRCLTSIPSVLHLTFGSISRTRSSSFRFTDLLHSRYKTKQDLASYSSHPSHLTVIKDAVLPICDDIMAVDWIADIDGPIVPQSNSAMRLTLLKLKESSGDEERGEILNVLGGIKSGFPEIEQISFGENFSPARAKGFTIGSISFFAGLKEIDCLDEKGEMVEMNKEKVRDLLENVIVVDYLISPPPSANL